MLTQHIALVPEAAGVDVSELARVSAALQKQVLRDLLPIWGVTATVDAFPLLEDVPIGYWPIIVCCGELGAQAGIHIDRNGQPYALVQVRRGWSVAASRACLEMLINPFENRTVTAPSLRSDQAPVQFLVEVCAPCEDGRNAYLVNGVVVSDFCTPAFFGMHGVNTERLSWSATLAAPLRLISGGHITWHDPISDTWWMRSHWGENPVDTQIGAIDRKLFSVRELVQACAPLRATAEHLPPEAFAGQQAQARDASVAQAHRLRSLLGTGLDSELEAAIDSILMRRERTAAAAAIQPMRRPDDIEVLLEIDDAEDYDFDLDDATLPHAPAQVATPAREQKSTRVANERPASTPPPQPVSSPKFPSAPSRAPARPSPVPASARVPAMAQPPLSLAPISLPIRPETPAQRGRSLFVGGVLSAAALLALAWAGRASLAGSAPSKAAATRAALDATSMVVAPPAVAPAPIAAATTPVPVADAAPVEVEVAAPAAERARETQAARSTARTRRHSSHSQSISSPAPPAPTATDDAPHYALEDLINTRR